MKVNVIRIFSMALVLLLVGACSTMLKNGKKQEARKALAEKGISFYENAFISAAKYNKIDIVKEFLDAGMDVNVNIDGTALIAATADKHLDMVKFLIKNGADVNQINYLGSALSAGVYVGNIDIAKVLIDNGADVNLASEDGTTPLIIASQSGKAEIIELLVNSGANVNYVTPVTGLTPLIHAASQGHLAAAEQLVKGGADVNYADFAGVEVLVWAMLGNYVDVAKLLIENGAKPSVNRVMIAALAHNDTEFVGYLIKNGADVNGKAFGKMPYIVWCAKNKLAKGAEILLKYGADKSAVDTGNGSTALDYALALKQYDLVKRLDPSIDINSLPKREGDPNLKTANMEFVNDVKLGVTHEGSNYNDEELLTQIPDISSDIIDTSKNTYDDDYDTTSQSNSDKPLSSDSLSLDNVQSASVKSIDDSVESSSPSSSDSDIVVPGEKQETSVSVNSTLQEAKALLAKPNASGISPNDVVPGEKQNTTVDTNKINSVKNAVDPAPSGDDNADAIVVPGQKQYTDVGATKRSEPLANSRKNLETFDPSAK